MQTLLTAACALLLAPSVAFGGYADQTPAPYATPSPYDQDLDALTPLPADATVEVVVPWLQKLDNVVERLASGGLPELPVKALESIQSLDTVVVANAELVAVAQVLPAVTKLLPSIWTTGFWYASIDTWQPLYSSVFQGVADVCKSSNDDLAYDALLNATSLIIRFTKDNVFMDGIDHGDLAKPAHEPLLTLLADVVSSASKLSTYHISAAQLRTYMNTIPSKRDGMNTNTAYPVFVDTTKYKESDAVALRAFVSTKPPCTGNPAAQHA
ncbi:hypothetical protein Poli38472_014235 [Pythium oligandrum]|uniref:Uncharacterized protein n=1 Tax=Pythium oligandrum TaxID=41045 RepID=A0A8K1CKN4_PYTOL|nr:hypothetical protein Poli38472_014235 [Pythium oligandrum]|eukprot:TMW64118.1 hypothetical protein Poli38472_014235 [Pythium oligandrum]